jgi:hypothetical protein
MTFREPDQEAIDVLVHVLASMMPDVLNKKRLERWLGFAKSLDELYVDVEDGDYNLFMSVLCEVCPCAAEYREYRLVNPTIQIFTPELGRIIGNKAMILKFKDEDIEVIYGSIPMFMTSYRGLPWLAIHALQTNPGNRTIAGKGIRP